MKTALVIDENTNIQELVSRYPQTIQVFAKYGLHCVGCHLSMYETIQQGAAAHQLPLEPLLADLQQAVAQGIAPAPGLVPGPSPTAVQPERRVEHVIAVASGKGGVGKSLVSALLALGLRRQGYRVGILDADITGASIPRMFGLNGTLAGQSGKIIPSRSDSGIEVVSTNLLVEEEDTPIAWRGPLIAGAIRQFYQDTLWDHLHYLVVDLPPGTSDAPLTVLQSLPVEGVVIVSSPQGLASMVVKKAARLAQKLMVPILGVVENMSYLVCPESAKQYEIFGPSKGEALAQELGVPFLAKLPLDPHLVELTDTGRVEHYRSPAVEELVVAFGRVLSNLKLKARL